MITFDDIKKEKEKTYTFVPNTVIHDLKWCLKQNNITDYEIHGYSQFQKVIPNDITIPSVRLVPLPEQDAPRLCRRPYVIISHMNTNELLEKIYDIIRGNDEDLQKYHDECDKRIQNEYEENYKGYLDGQIPVATK